MLDEGLLRELDGTPEVSRDGRSAVVRRALAAYLRRQREEQIRERYRRAYSRNAGLGPEFAGWETRGTWPDE